MRGYLKSRALKISPQQLDVLVPAFGAPWIIAWKRFVPNQDQEAARERLAQAVVDLVIAGGMTNADNIAAAAVQTCVLLTGCSVSQSGRCRPSSRTIIKTAAGAKPESR